MDRIELNDFGFDTIVGILEREQRIPQPLTVRISMELPLEETAHTGDLAGSINYAAVQQWVLVLAQQGGWPLIESLSHAIARAILAPPAACEQRAQVHAVEVELRKPTILTDAVPGVVIRRDLGWCDLKERAVAPGVVVGTLETTPKRAALRAVFAPGARWKVPDYLHLFVLGGDGIDTSIDEALTPDGHVPVGSGRVVQAGPGGLALLAVGRLDG